jgi:hypothetical protein
MRRAVPALLLSILIGAAGCADTGGSASPPSAASADRDARSTPASAGPDREALPLVEAAADATPSSVPATDAAPGEPGAPGWAEDTLPPPSFERPDAIRGIYVNAWAAGSSRRMDALVELARRTEVNTFVIDVKDASGYVSYPTDVRLAREVGADGEIRIRNIRRLLHRLEEEGIYPVARIVVFKDPVLAERWSEVAVQDSTGAPWVDGKGHVWVNPYDERVWSYHEDLAREAVELGFPEIQWDYVRFPDRPASEMALAVFPGAGERSRSQAIRDFLVHTREGLADLGVPLGADVFGVAATFRRDVGIGQLWEDFIDVVDVALPMVYPSHYWEGSYGHEHPNGHPYEIVKAALTDALRRTEAVEGAGAVIPWLQDFTLGAPSYGPAEVRAQILATYDAGIEEWILWNASSRYTEEALEPTGGWLAGLEPPIRFGGRIVPAATRLIESVEADDAEPVGTDEG